MSVISREIGETVYTGDFIANEVPLGDIDSINTNFTLLHDPVVGTVHISYNGIMQKPGSTYTISGKNITFVKAPKIDSKILAYYIRVT